MTQHLSLEDEYILARRLAKNFGNMTDRLATRARKLGISQDSIAAHLDWAIEDVRDVECADSDPSLSMIQDYARATGAEIRIEVLQYNTERPSVPLVHSLPVRVTRTVQWDSEVERVVLGV